MYVTDVSAHRLRTELQEVIHCTKHTSKNTHVRIFMQLAQNHQKNFRPEEMQSKHVNNSFLRPNEFTLIYFLKKKNGTL